MSPPLEMLLRISAAFLINFAVAGKTLASKIFGSTAPEVKVISESSGTIGKSTLNENVVAWEENENIFYAYYNENSPAKHQLTFSGKARDPDMFENNLAFQDDNKIMLANLENKTTKCIYLAFPYSSCEHPSVSEDYVVFRVRRTSPEFSDRIWTYSIKTGRLCNLLTSHNNEKGKPKVSSRYAVWPELVEKPDSDLNLIEGDFDIHAYDILTNRPFIYDPNLEDYISAIDNNPYRCSDSVAINDNDVVVYSINTTKDGNSGFRQYRIGTGKRSQSFPAYLKAEMNDLQMHENVLTWTRHYHSGRGIPDRIEGIVLIGGVLTRGFRVDDQGGAQKLPDVYKTSEKEAFFSFVSDNDTTQTLFVAGPYDTSAEFQLLRLFNVLWLNQGENPADYNKDRIINWKDFARYANKIGN